MFNKIKLNINKNKICVVQFVEEKIENDAKKSIFSNLLDKFWGEIKIDLDLDQVYDSRSIDKLRHIKKFLKFFKDCKNKTEQI